MSWGYADVLWYCSLQVFVSCSWCCWKWLCSWVSRSMSMWSLKASSSHHKIKRMRVKWPFSFSIPSLIAIPLVPYHLIEMPLWSTLLPHYTLHSLHLKAVPQFPKLCNVLSSGIGWRAEVHPKIHPVSELEFDVIIGADGRRNTLSGKPRDFL